MSKVILSMSKQGKNNQTLSAYGANLWGRNWYLVGYCRTISFSAKSTSDRTTIYAVIYKTLSNYLPVCNRYKRLFDYFVTFCRTLIVCVGNASPTSLFNMLYYLIMCYLLLLQAGHTQNMRVQLNFFFLRQVYFSKVGYFQRLDKDNFFLDGQENFFQDK